MRYAHGAFLMVSPSFNIESNKRESHLLFSQIKEEA